jgi:hypothetical protein
MLTKIGDAAFLFAACLFIIALILIPTIMGR